MNPESEASVTIPNEVVDKRYALDRLDDAFLFVLGVVGLLFTIIQVYQRADLTSFAKISPLLVLGVALPFYVGYIRGAIRNSLIERLRGWIYLVVGVSAYCALISITPMMGLLSFSFFILIFITFISIEYIERWFRQAFQFQETPQNMFSLSGTVLSSLILAYGFVFATRILENTIQLSLLFIQLLIGYVCVVIALMSEKLSRQAQSASLKASYQRTLSDVEASKSNRFRFLRLVIYLSLKLAVYAIKDIGKYSKSLLILTFAFTLPGLLLFENPQFQWLPQIIPAILMAIALVCFSVIAFFFLTKKEIDFSI